MQSGTSRRVGVAHDRRRRAGRPPDPDGHLASIPATDAAALPPAAGSHEYNSDTDRAEDEPPSRDDQHAVADREDLRQVGRDHEDRHRDVRCGGLSDGAGGAQSVRATEAISRIEASPARRVRPGRRTAPAMTATMSRLDGSGEPQSLSDADLIVEAIVEDLQVKRDAFAVLDQVTKPAAILASSTSSLPVAACATATSRPDRVLGMHFFNPATAMKLIDLVRTYATSDQVVATVSQLAASLDKQAVECADRAGFIVNALLFPHLNRAAALLDQNLDPETVRPGDDRRVRPSAWTVPADGPGEARRHRRYPPATCQIRGNGGWVEPRVED